MNQSHRIFRMALMGITFIGVAFGVCACASTGIPSQNVDPDKNNRATFRKDLKECQEDYPEAGSGVHIRQWEGCMNLKGWK